MRKTLPDGVCAVQYPLPPQVVCCFVKGFKSYYISSVGTWADFKSANARAGAGHVYGILIGFTCKTWHCLYKIQCIGINKGTEQQTQQGLQKGEERKGVSFCAASGARNVRVLPPTENLSAALGGKFFFCWACQPIFK